jgi:hypothetical protein
MSQEVCINYIIKIHNDIKHYSGKFSSEQGITVHGTTAKDYYANEQSLRNLVV